MARQVVVVCGWLGAKSRFVNKYAELYRSLGFDTIVLLCHDSHFLLPANILQRNVINAFDNKQHVQIIPHMLSNGGCRAWYCAEQQLQRAKVSFEVRAMVFDSAPSGSVANASDFAQKSAEKLPLLPKIYLKLFLMAMKWYPIVTRTHDMFDSNCTRFLEEQKNIPKLFLYTPHDDIVDPKDIKHAIAKAKAYGTAVESVEFENAKHVSLYTHDPAKYIASLQAFLKN